jgi:hypothetical protein
LEFNLFGIPYVSTYYKDTSEKRLRMRACVHSQRFLRIQERFSVKKNAKFPYQITKTNLGYLHTDYEHAQTFFSRVYCKTRNNT